MCRPSKSVDSVLKRPVCCYHPAHESRPQVSLHFPCVLCSSLYLYYLRSSPSVADFEVCLSEMRIQHFLSELTSVPGSLSLCVSLVSPFSEQRRVQSVLLMAYMCLD